jgi:hypothetical protein
MPASETPTNPTETEQTEDGQQSGRSSDGPVSIYSGRSSSRYIDYDTHELLDKITQYEDERRWQRIREGIWISILAHIVFFAALYFVPRYVFHQTQIIDPIDAIKNRKDLTYLDELPDAIKQVQKLKKVPTLKPNEAQVDKKTLDALKALEKARPKPQEPKPAPQQPAPQQQAEVTAPPTPQPQPVTPPSVAPPQPNPPLALETPRPASVPAKPNFSMPSANPEDQLRQAMRGSAHEYGSSGAISGGPGLAMHPGAAGGAQILSDTQGVDFGPYMQKLIRETHRTWDPLIPEEVNPPISKRGQVEIIFSILPNGRVQPQSMILSGRSGDVALDRAAWGGITGADYPPLPRDFHGPYLQLRFIFQYNMR